MILSHKNLSLIDQTINKICKNNKKIAYFMQKVARKSQKTIDLNKNKDSNAVILLILFKNNDYNGKIKKVINKIVSDKAENSKNIVIKNYVTDSQKNDRWIYLASSHNDCAKDHKPYQGKLYYDENAPEEIIKLAKQRSMRTIQWVMDAPAWFITRPNCRHFFKSLPTDVVKKYNRKELTRRYKMHRKVGDRSLATPKTIAIEEYEDRLKMLEAMYSKHPVEHLRRDIEKTKLLIKKWKNIL